MLSKEKSSVNQNKSSSHHCALRGSDANFDLIDNNLAADRKFARTGQRVFGFGKLAAVARDTVISEILRNIATRLAVLCEASALGTRLKIFMGSGISRLACESCLACAQNRCCLSNNSQPSGTSCSARPAATAAPLLEGPGNLVLIEGSIKMRVKKIAKLFVVSIVILTGSPALAAQIVRHDGYCRSCEQKAGACRDRSFGTCVGRERDAPRWNRGNTTHDDWSAGMILG